MRAGPASISLLLLLAMPCHALEVKIDYDEEVDFTGIKTFAWVKTPETSLADDDAYMHSRIVNAIEDRFSRSGLAEVEPENNPDVNVTYHTETTDELRVDTATYGYGSSWYQGGDRSSRPLPETFTQGTLIIDIWDPETQKLIWRGSITAAVPEEPRSAEKTIVKGLKKLTAEWRKIRADAPKP